MLLNDHIALVVERHPKRFIGLGTPPMQSPALAVLELERCVELGLSGIEIGSHIQEDPRRRVSTAAAMVIVKRLRG